MRTKATFICAVAAFLLSACNSANVKESIPLPEHPIEWIDFGMMGTLTTKQRQLLIDIVTCVVMQDPYGLKNTVLQVAQPMGEINHGAMLELCQGMCAQYTGADFGDFELGESKYLERTITFSDMLEQPSNWASRYMNSYYGTYSKAKHQLMMQVVGGKVDEEWVNEAYNSVSFRYYWRMKFIEALQDFNNDPKNIAAGLAPMRENADDPNSALVTFPTSM